jgi:hypothetical protein
MSSNYPGHQGHQGPQQPPPPYQYGAPQPGAAPAPYPSAPVPGGPHQRPGRAKGPRAGVVIAAVIAVIALGVGGMMVFGGGDDGGPGGEGSGSGAELTPNPDLERIDFPDAQALNYSEGPDAACGAVSEVMTARNYEFDSAGSGEWVVECWYDTPAASTLEDGDYQFRTSVSMTVGSAAEPAYDHFLSSAASYQGDEGRSPLYAFPVGEEGWIVHSRETEERGDGMASFRRGDTTFHVTVRGWIEHPDSQVREPLTEDITFREITDIVTALGGGQAGEPQLSESAAQEYPGDLEDFGEPLPPTEGSGDERCAPMTTVAAGQLDVRQTGATVSEDPTDVVPSFHCVYEATEAAYENRPTAIRTIRIDIEDLSVEDTMYPAGELGNDLRFTMDELSDSEGAGQLYALPAGTSGYMIYEDDGNDHGRLTAGYVVGDYYVSITMSGNYWPDGYTYRALTEEEMVDDLSTVLTAMNG